MPKVYPRDRSLTADPSAPSSAGRRYRAGVPRVRAADGVEVAVYELGGQGPPLVLAHAAGFHGRVWQPLAECLGPDFRCVAFDSRGHGDSGPPPGRDFHWRGFALDVLAVVDWLGDEVVFGLGHSSGGAGVLLAEEERAGTFAALYCYEPVIVPADPPLGPDAANWLAEGARRRRQEFSSFEEAYAHYAARPPLSTFAPAALKSYVEGGFEPTADGGVRLKCRGEDEALVYEMASAHDGYGRLGMVRCPVTLACGGETDALDARAMQKLADRMPAARVEVVTGLGHFGPFEDPDAFARAVRSFFRSPGPR